MQRARPPRIAHAEDTQIAEKDLVVTLPICLGLGLYFSAFQCEVFQIPDEACKMARVAFEDAFGELDHVAEDSINRLQPQVSSDISRISAVMNPRACAGEDPLLFRGAESLREQIGP